MGDCPRLRFRNHRHPESLSWRCWGWLIFYGQAVPGLNRLARTIAARPQQVAGVPPGAQGAPVKVGRNESCPCGSGRKYKHCHGS